MNTNNCVAVAITFVGFMPLMWHIGNIVGAKLIARAKVDRAFKNELASLTYMIIGFAPGISSYAVISAITENDTQDVITLWTIFFLGVIVNHYGRKLRNILFEKTRLDIPGFKKSDYLKVMRGEKK